MNQMSLYRKPKYAGGHMMLDAVRRHRVKEGSKQSLKLKRTGKGRRSNKLSLKPFRTKPNVPSLRDLIIRTYLSVALFLSSSKAFQPIRVSHKTRRFLKVQDTSHNPSLSSTSTKKKDRSPVISYFLDRDDETEELRHVDTETNKNLTCEASKELFTTTVEQKNNIVTKRFQEKQDVSILGELRVPTWAMRPPILRQPIFEEKSLIEENFELHRNYKGDKDGTIASEFDLADFATNENEQVGGLTNKNTNRRTEQRDVGKKTILPPWLSSPIAYKASQKLANLKESMSSYLTSKERQQIIQAVKVASGKDMQKLAGVADFLTILVNTMEMDKDCLMAAAFHYCSCVTVREDQGNMWSSIAKDKKGNDEVDLDIMTCYLCPLVSCGIEKFGSNAMQIALDAAKLKGTETLAAAVVNRGEKEHAARARPDSFDADNLRSLFLSVNAHGDWRALAIRTAASLYRLRGIESYYHHSTGSVLTTAVKLPAEAVRVAREALLVYAPLAHQLGMYRLKSELEETAFRLLYPIQHSTVSALYRKSGVSGTAAKANPNSSRETIITFSGGDEVTISEGMESVLADVKHRVKRRLMEDDVFMEQIESVSVTARIKEPFSLWRKMLKKRQQNNEELSVLDVHDALALRVVLKARKLTPTEEDEVTSAREVALCYYVIKLCMNQWPLTEKSRFKDYINNAKKNGYRSLHYSSKMRWRGEDWPFEVQVRSSEMHRMAEYGLAAHWDYKLQSFANERTGLDTSSDAYLKSVDAWRKQQQYRHVESSLSSINPEISNDKSIEAKLCAERKRKRNKQLAPYLEALSNARKDLAREKVFVFFSYQDSSQGGTILSLPHGACVLDALRKAENRLVIDRKMMKNGKEEVVMRNGVMATATQRLQNGDVLIIPLLESSEKKIEMAVL